MEYMSCPEAAEKWGISERRVQILCKQNRIPGVSKIGYMWLIPKAAEKPTDGRRKGNKKQIIPYVKPYIKCKCYIELLRSKIITGKQSTIHKARCKNELYRKTLGSVRLA